MTDLRRPLHLFATLIATTPVLPIGGICNRAAAQTPEVSEIVVTARRSRTIKPEDVTDTVPPETIKAYGEDSIGALLNRLSARFGRNFSVVVNGRRLASVDAINALPPEALAKIEVLKASKAGEYGLSPGGVIINLALRPRFQFTTIDAGGSVTTEGAGDAENAALRHSRIRQDTRFNAALAYSRQGSLRQSDRVKSGNPAPDPSAAYRSLVGHQDAATLTAGFSRPLGALNLDLSADASLVRTDLLTGLVNASDASGVGAVRSSSQRSETRSIRSGATVSGNAGHYFWSVLLSGEMSWSTTADRQGELLEIAPQDGETRAGLGPEITSRSKSVGATSTFSGPLFDLPAGPVTFDGSIGLRLNSLTSTVVATPPQSARKIGIVPSALKAA